LPAEPAQTECFKCGIVFAKRGAVPAYAEQQIVAVLELPVDRLAIRLRVSAAGLSTATLMASATGVFAPAEAPNAIGSWPGCNVEDFERPTTSSTATPLGYLVNRRFAEAVKDWLRGAREATSTLSTLTPHGYVIYGRIHEARRRVLLRDSRGFGRVEGELDDEQVSQWRRVVTDLVAFPG
jgi:hypothetical protein